MVVDQMLESTSFLDPFWLEHGKQIRLVSEVIEDPKTRVGKEIQKSLFNGLTLTAYNRLRPIFSSLITLTEYDEIGKAKGKNYFSGPVNQEIFLRSVKLLVEDSVKLPCSWGEQKKYDDYQEFFEGTLSRLKQLDKQILVSQGLPNFVNSLVMIISQETNKLRGQADFSIKMESIRKIISRYLSLLERVDNGKLLSMIQAELEMPLAGANST